MTATKTKKTLKMEGSVRLRENGSWEYRIFIGKDINGKLKYKSIYAKTEKELKAKIKDIAEKYIEGEPIFATGKDVLKWREDPPVQGT